MLKILADCIQYNHVLGLLFYPAFTPGFGCFNPQSPGLQPVKSGWLARIPACPTADGWRLGHTASGALPHLRAGGHGKTLTSPAGALNLRVSWFCMHTCAILYVWGVQARMQLMTAEHIYDLLRVLTVLLCLYGEQGVSALYSWKMG